MRTANSRMREDPHVRFDEEGLKHSPTLPSHIGLHSLLNIILQLYDLI